MRDWVWGGVPMSICTKQQLRVVFPKRGRVWNGRNYRAAIRGGRVMSRRRKRGRGMGMGSGAFIKQHLQFKTKVNNYGLCFQLLRTQRKTFHNSQNHYRFRIEFKNSMNKESWSQTIIRKSSKFLGLPIKEELTTTTFKRNDWLPSNEIHTSKYTWWSFLPKNLFQQFSKLPNLYFLIIGIFQILPFSTSTQGVPTVYIPLSVIIFVTAIKDLVEDRQRTLSDSSDNQQSVTYLTKTLQEIIKQSRQIYSGDVLKIHKNQVVPADGLVIKSSSGEVAYVETANIDGETALKKKIAGPVIKEIMENSPQIVPEVTIEYQPPNTNMNNFVGRVLHKGHKIPLNNSNILLRSSKLKNTDYVYLLVLYTGHQSKIVLSMNKPNQKKSVIEQKLGYTIFGTFLLMVVLSMIASLLKIKLRQPTVIKHAQEQHPAVTFFVGMLLWILNLSNLVPISLLVTVETVKLIQSRLLVYAPKMRNKEFRTIVNCSNILEDMGVIDCVASDKTGTLTKNKLTLRMLSDGILSYSSDNKSFSQELLSILCTAHEVSLSHSEEFEGVSQDQIAILQFCRDKGIVFHKRTNTEIHVRTPNKIQVKKILKNIEFTSQRKKQTTIYEQEEKIYVVVKGADEEMMKLITCSQAKQNLSVDINKFAKNGLRTLVYGYKNIGKKEYECWIEKYKRAETDRNILSIQMLLSEMEDNLNPLCATGIEDQLQDEVVQTVKSLLSANIKFVIISGDKQQTVMAIAGNLCISERPFLATQSQYKEQYSKKSLVVFARCTPKDKQKIVKSIPGKVLAIGDGANDVCMLTKATIGVGINGKEGKAAVQAGDVGIPEFKYLKRLLFYYGCELCRKNATLVKYNFYKNFVYALPQFVFGAFSGFAGLFIYQNTLSQLFNLLFSTLPIIIFALFDEDTEQQDLLKNTQGTYQLSRRGTYFNKTAVALSMLQAFIQTIVSSFLIFFLLPKMFRSPDDLDIVRSSTVIFSYVVITVNLVLLADVKLLSLGYFISIVITLASFYIVIRIIQDLVPELKYICGKMMNMRCSVLLVLVIMITMTIHYLFKLLNFAIENNNKVEEPSVQDTELSLKRELREERVAN